MPESLLRFHPLRIPCIHIASCALHSASCALDSALHRRASSTTSTITSFCYCIDIAACALHSASCVVVVVDALLPPQALSPPSVSLSLLNGRCLMFRSQQTAMPHLNSVFR
ncbi:hypothetical protein KP509_09G005100 [Ceratopteris richardii]|uniref:Uncharacterized protein n=1 Tax=Ceratopteris richardii TaxID=49495 RepID=A0A8T2U4T8_CERRI|nr:hypothetical protein KP509_09G005100 [Ceratopteris richardii]